jgi:hypothetical protein
MSENDDDKPPSPFGLAPSAHWAVPSRPAPVVVPPAAAPLSLEEPSLGTGRATLDAIPVLLVTADALDDMELGPRARQLLTNVNDEMTVEEILDRLRIDADVGLAFFEQLAEDGLVAFV